MLDIEIISCLEDNYSYIIHDKNSNLVGVVDPSEFKTIDKHISKKLKKLDYIFNTHHHFDHVGGNNELINKYSAKVIGSKIDEHRIPGVGILLNDNDLFKFGNIVFKVIFVPGHTKGHIAFYSEEEKIVFTGDALFSLGCGRIFEGDYLQMFTSLEKIKKLPKATKIYCGHEYTKNNYDFCNKYDTDNVKLTQKREWINSRFVKKIPTLPTTIEEELNTNIFLRCNNLSIKKGLGMTDSPDELIFKKLRNLKDGF